MALIKSISGIRGTIGGRPGESLSPGDVVKFTAAFGSILKGSHSDRTISSRIVVGRDGQRDLTDRQRSIIGRQVVIAQVVPAVE